MIEVDQTMFRDLVRLVNGNRSIHGQNSVFYKTRDHVSVHTYKAGRLVSVDDVTPILCRKAQRAKPFLKFWGMAA